MMPVHPIIEERLKLFHANKKIPNILFHGPVGSGKKTILKNFITLIYNNDKLKMKDYVMYVNCSHGKGIKFVRDDLKFFAKTQINTENGNIFKSVILINADKLTFDAQSAIRRCIELFSNNTRFFIIVEDKYKLLRPILSRFCEISVNYPNNLNSQNHPLAKLFAMNKSTRQDSLKKELEKITPETDLTEFSEKMYEKGYSCLDVADYIEKSNRENKWDILMTFNKMKRDIRSERFLILFILHFLGSDSEFKNIYIY